MIMLSIPALSNFSKVSEPFNRTRLVRSSLKKLYLAAQLVFACSTTLTKLSLLFFYLRIFPIKKFKIVSDMIGCLMIAWWIFFVVAMLLTCRPFAFF